MQTSTTIEETLPPMPVETGLTDDLQEIKQGWENLPEDLLAFLLAIEQRLQEVETLLATLLNGTTSLPSGNAVTETPAPVPAIIETLSGPLPAQTSYCMPHGGAGPLTPCPAAVNSPSTPRSTSTLTSTLSQTTTVYAIATHNRNGTQTNGTFTHNTSPALQTIETISPVVITPSAYPNKTFSSAIISTRTTFRSTEYTGFINGTVLTSIPLTFPPQPSATPYKFNAIASDNVAVYYGATSNTTRGGLLALCESPDVDIVNLAFVYDFFSASGYPSIRFGPGCTGPNAQQASTAPGLSDCTALAPEIASCQELGKKVLVSLGGYVANTTIYSDAQAVQLASTLWSLFGNGDSLDGRLRPFGAGIVVDGFDLDNESGDSAHWQTLATSLRQAYANDTSKDYYLSSAPQCPRPDQSIPLGAMLECDWVYVQFYNNPSCNLDSSGFQSSFAAWSSDLAANGLAHGVPKLFIGAGGWSGAGSGYVVGSGLETTISQARELNTGNLGGIMLWEGTEAFANVDQYGDDYLVYAKVSLQ